MINGNALFLCELLSEDLSLYAAMDVPLNEIGCEIQQSGEGLIDAQKGNCVRWERYREMGSFSISPDDSFRFGQCVDVVRVERSGADVLAPCFILPSDGAYPVIKEVTVSTQLDSAFDMAGSQANLWLGAYSEFKYQGFMGTLDREFIERSKTRPHEPRDKFLIEVSGNQGYGVLELIQMASDATWNALLHLPLAPQSNIANLDLYSVHQIGIDGISAIFRQRFAKASVVEATARA